MRWGFAGVPHGDFRWWDGDQTLNKLAWCRARGFSITTLRLEEADDPARREQLLASRGDLEISAELGGDWWQDDVDALRRTLDAQLARIERDRHDFHLTVTHSTPGMTHRFHPDRPIAWQLDRLAQILRPYAARLAEIGCPLAMENHGDYYTSDLVELCQRVPGMGIQLDTGNCFLIGERPLEAAKIAAPYVLATHLKDHIVFPSHNGPEPELRQSLQFVLRGASLGEGHVGIGDILHVLWNAAQDPERIALLWELVPPKDMNGEESVERSWKHVRAAEQSWLAQRAATSVGV